MFDRNRITAIRNKRAVPRNRIDPSTSVIFAERTDHVAIGINHRHDKRAGRHLKELWKKIDYKHRDKLSPKHLEDGENIRKAIEALRAKNKKK